MIELQPFDPRVGDHATARSEPGAQSTNVHPVGSHHREPEELVADEYWGVGHHIVQVLATDALVIHEDRVTRLKGLFLEPIDGVLDHDVEVGDEVRDAPDVLGEQLPVRAHDGAGEVPHLVDHHVVGRALQILRHLVRRCGE